MYICVHTGQFKDRTDGLWHPLGRLGQAPRHPRPPGQGEMCSYMHECTHVYSMHEPNRIRSPSSLIHTYIHAYTHACMHAYSREAATSCSGLPSLMHTYIHTYMHAYKHACMHTYIHAYPREVATSCSDSLEPHTCIHACMHTCMHAYMHTCIHACMHTCIHSYIHTYILCRQLSTCNHSSRRYRCRWA